MAVPGSTELPFVPPPTNRMEAIVKCSDKNFGDIKQDEVGNWWVKMVAKNQASIDSFRREIRAIKYLQQQRPSEHPGRNNIIRFQEWCEGNGETPSLWSITVEYIWPFGFDLQTLAIKQDCSNGQKLPVDSLAHYIGQVMQALDYLHEIKLVHGDLKGQNVLINTRAEIKIIDFGYAACIDCPCQDYPTYPKARYIPDKARGKRVKPETFIDKYSFGVMLLDYTILLLEKDAVDVKMTAMKLKESEKCSKALKDIMQGSTDSWLQRAKAPKGGNGNDAAHKPEVCVWERGYAMRIDDEIIKLGATIGEAKLMQKGIQVLYVDRKHRAREDNLGRLATDDGGEAIERLPGYTTKLCKDDWMYFLDAAQDRDTVFQNAITQALNPCEKVKDAFPTYLSFKEVELPEEVDGFALGPMAVKPTDCKDCHGTSEGSASGAALLEGDPRYASRCCECLRWRRSLSHNDILWRQYRNLPEATKGFLDLRNTCQINLAGVRRGDHHHWHPGAAFLLKKGDYGLFVQAVDVDGRRCDTHDADWVRKTLKERALQLLPKREIA